jgi:O-antigen ligase
MKRPTGVTVMACILLFMAAGVANGLITVLSEQALKRGVLALYVGNILILVALCIALLKMQSWSRWVWVVLCAISLVLIPRQLVVAHSLADVVRVLGWGSFRAWAIWYLFRPHVKQAFGSLHGNSQEHPHETSNPA